MGWVCLVAVGALGQSANTISTIAGGGPNNLAAMSSSVGLPWSVVQDTSKNTYVSDTFSNRIFKINASTKTLTVLAGNGVNNFVGDNGPASAAALSGPQGIALDASGNVYIADTGNNVIRVVNTQSIAIHITGVTINAGQIATVAGSTNGTACASPTSACGDSGLATSAQLNLPGGVAVDSLGDIFIADTGDNRIREVATSGIITTVAGTGTACSPSTAACGDGAAALSALLNAPSGIFVDLVSGNIFIADTLDNRIRELTGGPAWTISTAVGTGTACSPTTAACGDAGPATAGNLTGPVGLFVDGSGDIFIADTADQRIREVSGGNLSTIAGNGIACSSPTAPFCNDGGPAVSALLGGPTGVFVDGLGDVFIADEQNDVVREVTAGNIATVIGVGFDVGFSGDGGSALNAELLNMNSVATDASGNVYVADSGNNVIRKIDAKTKNISTVAGDGTQCVPANFPCGDGGPATAAQLWSPQGVFVDASGNIFIADKDEIREVSAATSKISTVAGSQLLPCSAPVSGKACKDGGAATAALLNLPGGVFVDGSGYIYIADTGSNVVRVVNTSKSTQTIAKVSVAAGAIATVAGDYTVCATPPSAAACGDGGAAISAKLNSPDAVYVDGSGNIFISDSNDHVVREVTASTGDITAVVGDYTACAGGACGNGTAAKTATLASPQGVWLDFAGDIFVADFGTNKIRAVNTQASSAAIAGVTIGAGQIEDVIGTGTPGFGGDGSLAVNATLDRPAGLGGDASGNLYITDWASGRVREVIKALGSPIPPSFSIPISGTLTPASVTAGTPATGTVTVTSAHGFNAAVALTCAVTPAATPAATCSFSSASVTPPANGSADSTLTVSTTAATSAALQPAVIHHASGLYAMWMLLPAMMFSTLGLGASRRKKLISGMLLVLAIGGCIFLVACGGGSSTTTGGGGGGTSGTPSGTYTVTVTAKSGASTQTETFTLTVQ